MSNSAILYAIVLAALLTGCPTKTAVRPDGTTLTETDISGSIRVLQAFSAERQKNLARIADPRTSSQERIEIVERIDIEDGLIVSAAGAYAEESMQTLLKSNRPMTMTITITPSAPPPPLPAPSPAVRPGIVEMGSTRP